MTMRSALALVLLLLTAAAARAADPREEAKKHVQAGIRHQNAGRYDEALAEYQAAYALAPLPAMLFNMAQVYRLKGDKAQAVEYYRKYLAVDPNGRGGEEAREHVTLLDREIRREAAETERLRAEEEAARRRADEEAERRRAAEAEAARERAEAVAAHQEALDRPGRSLRTAGLVTGGAGALALVVGVYFGMRAQGLSNDVSNVSGAWTDAADRTARDDGPAAQRDMVIFTVLGAAAIATGGVLYYLGVRERRRASAEVVPEVTSTSASLVLVGRF
jgi:tetratricopeptide (TPR) repeat protein